MKRGPGRPSKKELQQREEEQKRREQRSVNKGKELKERLIKRFKDFSPSNAKDEVSEEGSPSGFVVEEEERNSEAEEGNEIEIALIEDAKLNSSP